LIRAIFRTLRSGNPAHLLWLLPND